MQFSEALNMVFVSTFHGKSTIPEEHPSSLGVMVYDYANFGFDCVDVVICVGYELHEMPPSPILLNADKKLSIIIISQQRLMPTFALAVI
ncbi:hypothetical protein [Microbulbifer variabilis]|nr:hypothetical protein [Microbulbifer variabilis]